MGQILQVNPRSPDPAVMRQAADCIRAGGIVIYPTETVYGIGACWTHQAAHDRIARLKGRAGQSPFLLLIRDIDDLPCVARDISAQALDLARRHWPGALTILFHAAPGLSPWITGAAGTVGCRVSPHPAAQALLAAAGTPLISSSANLSGGPNPACPADIPATLMEGADVVLDGGPTPGSMPSTIVDATGSSLKLIRRGALDIPGMCP